MTLNPFDLHGPAFLALYGLLLALTVIAGIVIPRLIRPRGRDTAMRDADGLALLAGGPTRFADAVLARLLARGALAVEGKTLVVRTPEAIGNEAEAVVLGWPGPLRLKAAHLALRRHAEPIRRRLVGAGLMLDAAETAAMRRWQTAPYLLLLLFGAMKWVIGVSRDRPVGFLSALLVLTAVLALARWGAVDGRTRAGQRLVDREQARADRLRLAPMAAEMDIAVALFGTVVLAGSAHAGLHTMRQSDASSGSSDGGGGDGGGCGGGGCGGCGS